jgi:hypothetical protein
MKRSESGRGKAGCAATVERGDGGRRVSGSAGQRVSGSAGQRVSESASQRVSESAGQRGAGAGAGARRPAPGEDSGYRGSPSSGQRLPQRRVIDELTGTGTNRGIAVLGRPRTQTLGPARDFKDRGGDSAVGRRSRADAPLTAGAVATARRHERLGHLEAPRTAVAGAGGRRGHQAAPAPTCTRSRSGAIRQRVATSAR